MGFLCRWILLSLFWILICALSCFLFGFWGFFWTLGTKVAALVL